MGFLKRTLNEFASDNCSTLAAALAYYTAFALPPLLYLLLSVLTFGLSVFYSSDAAESRAQDVIQNQTTEMIGNETASQEIRTILENNKQADGKWWKSLLSFLGIVVGATGVVAALQAALNQIWEVKPDPRNAHWYDVIIKRIFSLGMILGLAFLLVVSLAASTVLSGTGDQLGSWFGMSEIFARVANFVVQAIVLFVVFAAIFKWMPDAKVQWRDVMVGAGITTVLFLVGRYLLQLYFTFSNPGAAMGAAAASFAVLLVWVYYTASIVLLGAEATQVYATEYGGGIQPEDHAVQVEERIRRRGESS